MLQRGDHSSGKSRRYDSTKLHKLYSMNPVTIQTQSSHLYSKDRMENIDLSRIMYISCCCAHMQYQNLNCSHLNWPYRETDVSQSEENYLLSHVVHFYHMILSTWITWLSSLIISRRETGSCYWSFQCSSVAPKHRYYMTVNYTLCICIESEQHKRQL